MSPRSLRPGPEDLDALIEKVEPEDLRVIVGKASATRKWLGRSAWRRPAKPGISPT